jgi:hypothetical protein
VGTVIEKEVAHERAQGDRERPVWLDADQLGRDALRARAHDARRQGHQGRWPVDHGSRSKGPLPHPRRADRRQGPSQAPGLLRRRHPRPPHLLHGRRSRAPDRRARRARRLCPPPERPHAADAPRAPRGHLHAPRRLREAASLFPARLHPDHDGDAPLRLLGEAHRGGPHSPAPHRLRRVPVGRGARRQARHLHQGRGRPLRGRPQEEPLCQAHPPHRRERAAGPRSARSGAGAGRDRIPHPRPLLPRAPDRERPSPRARRPPRRPPRRPRQRPPHRPRRPRRRAAR